MLRLLSLCLVLVPLYGQAQSLKSHELNLRLEAVATQSSIGTPRLIANQILDKGFSVNGNQLINHLGVIPEHAEQMQANPGKMRDQLRTSVCRNQGFVSLLEQGAILRYQFNDLRDNRRVLDERFTRVDCL